MGVEPLSVGDQETQRLGVPKASGVPLPSGIVTFVFTDIEGSTQLLRRWGARYEQLLERHRTILRAVWRDHRGCEVATEGDAFFVAFEHADDAIEACAAAQRELQAEPWPDQAVVLVRMGVHCGLAWPRGDNYVALAVHQAARVVSAAHGGQVLATAAAAERAGIRIHEGDAGPSSATGPTELVVLGRFRVRDFDEPVQLLQVTGHGLLAEFPALRVLPADRHNLVAPPNELFGRDADLAELEALTIKSNLVTLVGPGGVGKTRLATEFGLRHATDWEDGAWLVDLTGVRDGALIPEALAEGIGAKVDGDTKPWDAVIEHLRGRHALLLVDNCEHLRIEVAQRVSQLLGDCPGVSVLATSREPLGLREERVCRPEPLAPDSAAVAMFAQRAGLGDDIANLDGSTRTTLVELCRVLDGLPLAIELAASRCDVLAPAEMLMQLKSQRSLLRSQDPTLAERQRSMEATIEWSHQLLEPHEQTAFRRLGVFADGFDLNAATVAVAGGVVTATATGTTLAMEGDLSAYDVPELVWTLASKSLITSELASGTTRYRMLETIRAYSRRLLDRSGDTDAVAADVATFYLESFGPHLVKLDANLIADRAREVNNLRALTSMLATSDPELAHMAAHMVVADVRQTSFLAALAEGRGFLEQLQAPTPGRVALLNNVAFILDEAQLPEEASVVLAEAESLAAAVGRPPWLEGRLEQERGIVEILRGHPDRARELALEGLTAVTSDRGRANLLELLMIAAMDLGDAAEALRAGDEALALSQERGDLELLSLLLSSLAEASWRLGDYPAAASRQLESLSLGMQTGRRRDIAFACIMAARLAAASDDDATATRLQSAADRLLDELGTSLYPADSALRDELLDGCRARLGEDRFGFERAEGSTLEVEDAVGVAREVLLGVAAS
jgi:predicted ATPase/class 3 adenylate cyclase